VRLADHIEARALEQLDEVEPDDRLVFCYEDADVRRLLIAESAAHFRRVFSVERMLVSTRVSGGAAKPRLGRGR
jgi:hypothetical protein